MVQLAADYPTRLGFRFENDEAASFLVLNCDAKVLEYQALMLEHNRMRHVLPVDVVIKEGMSCYYYNITSKISLSFLLARRKCNREEFLKLLLNITSVINESAGYLLTVSNFVFDPDYIYISPETLDPMLVYVPAVLEGGCGTTLQTFISELLMQHIHVDGFSSGNLVQRILAETKSEQFNVKSLIIVINDLLYANASYVSDMSPGRNIVEEWTQPLPLQAGKEKTAIESNMPGSAILLILVQVVMGIAIYAGRNFLNNISNNATATYAAVVMIVIAIDLFLYRKLKISKLIHVSTAKEEVTESEEKINKAAKGKSASAGEDRLTESESANHIRKSIPPERVNHTRKVDAPESVKAAEPSKVHQKSSAKQLLARVEAVVNTDRDAIRAASEAGPLKAVSASNMVVPASRPAASASGKTELLARSNKGVRMLKSTRKQNGDEDILLNKDDLIIGRLAGHVDHVLESNAVGKLHAQVLYKNGACYIKDLNSVNGTFINGNRIDSNKEYEIKENDRVLLANSEFMYIVG